MQQICKGKGQRVGWSRCVRRRRVPAGRTRVVCRRARRKRGAARDETPRHVCRLLPNKGREARLASLAIATLAAREALQAGSRRAGISAEAESFEEFRTGSVSDAPPIAHSAAAQGSAGRPAKGAAPAGRRAWKDSRRDPGREICNHTPAAASAGPYPELYRRRRRRLTPPPPPASPSHPLVPRACPCGGRGARRRHPLGVVGRGDVACEGRGGGEGAVVSGTRSPSRRRGRRARELALA